MNSLSLGIPGVGSVSPGTHFCALYSGPAERDRLLFPFLEEGLRHGGKCLCLIDDVEPAPGRGAGGAERGGLLFPVLEEGLRHGDKCLCLIDDVESALVRDQVVGQPGREYSRRSAQLDVERASDTYLRSGEFSVEDMMSFLSESVDAAIGDDFDLLRAAGEMSWVMPGPPGWNTLVRYESAVSQAVDQMPAILM